jgi:hypothetical protein
MRGGELVFRRGQPRWWGEQLRDFGHRMGERREEAAEESLHCLDDEVKVAF